MISWKSFSWHFGLNANSYIAYAIAVLDVSVPSINNENACPAKLVSSKSKQIGKRFSIKIYFRFEVLRTVKFSHCVWIAIEETFGKCHCFDARCFLMLYWCWLIFERVDRLRARGNCGKNQMVKLIFQEFLFHLYGLGFEWLRRTRIKNGKDIGINYNWKKINPGLPVPPT